MYALGMLFPNAGFVYVKSLEEQENIHFCMNLGKITENIYDSESYSQDLYTQ